MKNTFELQLKVLPENIDQLGHVNNVIYLDWVQQVARAHWYNKTTPEVNEKYHWVVVRHEIDYYKPAIPNDTISCITWVEQMQGVKSMRWVEIKRGNTLLAKAKTVWALLNSNTGKPSRIPESILNIFF